MRTRLVDTPRDITDILDRVRAKNPSPPGMRFLINVSEDLTSAYEAAAMIVGVEYEWRNAFDVNGKRLAGHLSFHISKSDFPDKMSEFWDECRPRIKSMREAGLGENE